MVIVGMFLIVFHKRVTHHSMDFWETVGLDYDEKFCNVFFVAVGWVLIVLGVLSLLGY